MAIVQVRLLYLINPNHASCKQPQSPGTQPEDFYLEIPVSFVNEHFRTPLKFLLYLAWCILGTPGDLLDERRQNLPLDGLLMDCRTYYYGPHETDDVLLYAVDLEVIQLRSTFNSSSSHIRDKAFDEELTQRDGGCIFTGVTSDVQGIHIIPHSKGDIQLIIANRPNDEVVDDMHSIDDIRNGMICHHTIHSLLEHRDAVVLKTPNAILTEDDVAPRCQRLVEPPPHTSYPLNSRYTFQRFESPRIAPHKPDQMLSDFLTPDNNDGAFLTDSPLSNSKPSGLLLDYIYGAAAVKRWGRNNSVITDRSIPRPEVKAAAMGPERTPGAVNREKFRKKRKLLETGGQEEVGASGSAGGLQDLDVNLDKNDAKREWDEDDIILFFWGNSKAARERHEKEDQKRKGYIEDWRSTVSAN